MRNANSFCVLASRPHFFDFDLQEEVDNRKLEFRYIPHIEYLEDGDQLLVANNEDLRSLSLDSGLITIKINEDSYPDTFVKGITSFVLLKNRQKVFITSKGGEFRDYKLKE